jgi:hypothetical protein
LAERARRPKVTGEELREPQLGGLLRDLAGVVATGVHRAHDRAHAGTDHDVGPDAEAVENRQDTQVRESLGPAPGEHQREPPVTARLAARGAWGRAEKQEHQEADKRRGARPRGSHDEEDNRPLAPGRSTP